MKMEHSSIRGRSQSVCECNEVFIIGEQIRQGLHCADLVKDRKYHFRTYKSCVVGKEMIDWLIANKHCSTRQAAIDNLDVLQKYEIFHHVCDDHVIKDQILFYRFRRDDGTYHNDRDLALFYKAHDFYSGMSARSGGIIRSYQQGGELFRNAFHGSDFIDYLLKEGEVSSRKEAVMFGRRLLENDTIRHVTDDYHFRDDVQLLYQFSLDFSRRRYLTDVCNFVPHHNESMSRRCSSQHLSSGKDHFYTPNTTPLSTPERMRKRHSSAPMVTTTSLPGVAPDTIEDDRQSSVSVDSGTGSDNGEEKSELAKTQSVLLRHATVHELESKETPYVKQFISISSDPVGYGFVVRGNGPTYIQAVDPLGPAAEAGLRVRQYLHSINGTQVMRYDHERAAKLIVQSESTLHLVVMTHKRDAIK